MTENRGLTHVFREESWEPIVYEVDGALIYEVPVASGHFDKTFRFAITSNALDVLKKDVERRYFLYALLHAVYQPRAMTTNILTDERVDLILFSSLEDVETQLNKQDKISNGAVSNLVRILMDRPQAPMRNGRWFKRD